MKTIRLLLIGTLMLLLLAPLQAQKNEIPADIITALNKGDAVKINSYLNSNVELVIGKKNDVFSKPQASGIITDFFKTNKVNSFLVLHKGDKEAASFLIGTLKTTNSAFRVYILTRKSDAQTVIQQLRIEPANEK
ncbi:MAG: DUF4783 domain-containing protein [Paludibacteraceae bacterium]|nr:DUF4783 domain-containing protein [Paludibacteraceae bacterium]